MKINHVMIYVLGSMKKIARKNPRRQRTVQRILSTAGRLSSVMYFRPCNEVSEKYDFTCFPIILPRIGINWFLKVFRGLEKNISQMIVPFQYSWYTRKVFASLGDWTLNIWTNTEQGGGAAPGHEYGQNCSSTMKLFYYIIFSAIHTCTQFYELLQTDFIGVF